MNLAIMPVEFMWGERFRGRYYRMFWKEFREWECFIIQENMQDRSSAY